VNDRETCIFETLLRILGNSPHKITINSLELKEVVMRLWHNNFFQIKAREVIYPPSYFAFCAFSAILVFSSVTTQCEHSDSIITSDAYGKISDQARESMGIITQSSSISKGKVCALNK
jgi:hypothetical protein